MADRVRTEAISCLFTAEALMRLPASSVPVCFEGDTLVQLPKPADNDAENQQEPDYAVVMEPKISENENQENKDSDYALIQEPKVAEQNCPANIDSDYAVVDLNTDEKKAPDSKDSDYSLAQAPKVAVQVFDSSNYYAVVQKPKANEKKTPTPKDSDYSLIQELEVSEQKSEDSKDSDYAVVQKPKVDKQKALDNKDSDYSLVQAPKDAEQMSFTLSDPFISKVSKGMSATLHCDPSLPAGSQAQWTWRGVSGDKRVIVTRQEDGREDQQNRFQIDDRFNIHIERVQPEDLGTYECGGRETSLIVLQDPSSLTVSEGESVTLYCGDSADLAGAGSVKWKQVNGGTDHPILYKDPAGNIVKSVFDPDKLYQLRPDSSLYIRKVKSADAGRYECNGIHVADLKVLTGEWFVFVLLSRFTKIVNQPQVSTDLITPLALQIITNLY
ncbi:hypothetical protein HHUSO_G31583 [Huso huso]|uniref:Basigin n=1 Tax=Huso huso TaxID=61971 RepID=A0ABR0YBX1_HUSHU